MNTNDYIIIIQVISLILITYSNQSKHLKSRFLDENLPKKCEDISTCFECSSPLSQCEWKDSICQKQSTKYPHWSGKLMNQCNDDDESKAQSLYYCQTNNKKKNSSYTFSIKETKPNTYGAPFLFCFFAFDLQKKKTQLNLKYIKSGQLSYQTIDIKNEIVYNDNFVEKETHFQNVKTLVIYYYSYTDTKQTPFEIEVETIESNWHENVLLFCGIIFAILLFIILMSTLIFFFVSFIRRRRLQTDGAERNNIEMDHQRIPVDTLPGIETNNITPTVGNFGKANNALVESMKLQTVKFDKDIMKIYNITCPICIEMINQDEEIIILSCKHGFHGNCLIKWLSKKNAKLNSDCPLCQMKITKTSSLKTEVDNIISHQVVEVPNV